MMYVFIVLLDITVPLCAVVLFLVVHSAMVKFSMKSYQLQHQNMLRKKYGHDPALLQKMLDKEIFVGITQEMINDMYIIDC